MNKSRSKKWQAFTQVLLTIGIALALNAIAQVYYDRIDLTADKRYTLSQPTKKLLRDVDDIIFFKVYLGGEDLPSGFRKLNEATLDMLEEFREIAGDKVQYQFINPDDLPTAKDRQKLYQQLSAEGLAPMSVEQIEGDQQSRRIIIPGAMVTYNNKSMPVVLVDQQAGNVPPEEALHNSVIALEYKFANAIQKLGIDQKPKIGLIQGHGELKPERLAAVENELKKYYQVDYVDLPRYKVGRLDPYEAIVIAKPDSTFDNLEQYKIDQYLMNGGKILWLVDALRANEDSLFTLGQTFTETYNLGIIDDLLFKYGVRINYDLVQDINCGYLPLNDPSGGSMGSPKYKLFKWPYYPITGEGGNHPITSRLSGVWFRYASTLDTLYNRQNPDVRKTVLLTTSPYTRVLLNPVRITLEDAVKLTEKQQLYRQGQKNLAVALEGPFNSAFMNRPPTPETQATGQYGQFKTRSPETKMIVVSDGDVIANELDPYKQPMELGYDRFTRQMFANKAFVLNCVDYLVDESGILGLRAKDVSFRPLDPVKVKSERAYWQWMNMGLPVVALLLFGVLYNYIRKRRFATRQGS